MVAEPFLQCQTGKQKGPPKRRKNETCPHPQVSPAGPERETAGSAMQRSARAAFCPGDHSPVKPFDLVSFDGASDLSSIRFNPIASCLRTDLRRRSTPSTGTAAASFPRARLDPSGDTRYIPWGHADRGHHDVPGSRRLGVV